MENIKEEFELDCRRLDTAQIVLDMIDGRRDLPFIERRKMITVQKDFARSLLYWFRINHSEHPDFRMYADRLMIRISKM